MPPTHIIEFLGVLFNMLNLTISVTPEKMKDILQDLCQWTHKKTYTRNQLEQLLGRLQFISNCVRPGRVMVLRLRNQHRITPNCGHHRITDEMNKDIQWWRMFLPLYNSTSLMWMHQNLVPDRLLATDASLQGMGAVSKDQ